ncbi:hypothetical protein SNE40_012224 [Patella caerulea]|uniref:Uncharacterized protein n=1 Tax=Patella caerulea TaxID=87958 RepID=A0AAN8PVJ7_PATCE
MKVAVFAVLVCAMVAVNGAPSKRFLENFGFGGLQKCPFPAMCFIDPCSLATCAGNPDATCRQGCACSAVWTDISGKTITC